MSRSGMWVDKMTLFDFPSWNQYESNMRDYSLQLMSEKKSVDMIEFVEIEEGVDYEGAPNSFNLMSLFYVSHHMDNAALRFFVRQARRLVCRQGYLVLKDHNLDDDINIALCQI